MGLNIKCYKNLKRTPTLNNEDEHYENDDLCTKQHYLYHIGSLVPDIFYTGDNFSDICAGSYSGFNIFRRNLLSLVSNDNIEDYWQKTNEFVSISYIKYHNLFKIKKLKRILNIESINNMINVYDYPFVEFIYFSDCEGVIGPEICEKLSNDFIKYNNLAKEKLNSYSYELYEDLMYNLKEISENGNGCLSFN